MICKYCGTENEESYKYCINCAASLAGAIQSTAQPVYNTQGTVQPSYNTQGTAQSGYNQQYYSQPPVQNGYVAPSYVVPPVQQIVYTTQPQKPAGVPGVGQCNAALVLGIIAISLCWIPVISIIALIIALIGLINGIIGVIRSSASGKVRPQGIVGLILSAITFIPAIIVMVAFMEEVL